MRRQTGSSNLNDLNKNIESTIACMSALSKGVAESMVNREYVGWRGMGGERHSNEAEQGYSQKSIVSGSTNQN